jgi:hypothetical protein
MRNAYNILVGKPEGRPFGRLRHKWEGIIRMDLSETGWVVRDCMHVAQDRDQWWAFVNTAMNLQVL